MLGFAIVTALLLTSCNTGMTVEVKEGKPAAANQANNPEFKITSVESIITSPGQSLALIGENFKALTGWFAPISTSPSAALTIDNHGSNKNPAVIAIENEQHATVDIPADSPFGAYSLTIEQGSTTQQLTLFSNGGKTDFPINTEAISEVCLGKKFYDATGILREGTKVCDGATSMVECAADGATGCIANSKYTAAATTSLADKVLAGQSVAGITGNVTLPNTTLVHTSNGAFGVGGTGSAPTLGDCATDGATGCVAVTNYPAAKLANFTSGDIRSGVTVAGIAGALTGAPASCASDGATGCVANNSFTAANMTGLASKVLSGQTVAGVSGNVTLPATVNVLAGTNFGVAGTGSTGSLTLPAVGNVLSTSGAFGVGGNGSTPTLTLPTAANVRVTNGAFGASGSSVSPTLADCATDGSTSCVAVSDYRAAATSNLADKVLSGQTVAGIPGNVTLPSAANVRTSNGTYGVGGTATTPTLADCSADGSTTCVATSTYTAALTTSLAPKIVSGNTVAGVAGTATAESHATCATDGELGCITQGPSYAAALTTGLASKVLSGQTVAGVSGNVTLPGIANVLSPNTYGVSGTGLTGTLTLPAVGKVLSGISYGTSGSGSTGTLTLPSAANVLVNSGTYGDPGSAVTPSLSFPPLIVRPTAPTLTSTAFNFSPERVTLTWGAVSGASGYLVIMHSGSAVTWTPTDGTSYTTGTQGSDTIIYAGTGTTVTYNTSISAGTTYYFALYSYEANQVYSYAPTTKTLLSCAGLAGGTWIAVPGDSIYGTNGFCVQKYIPSNVSSVPTSQTGTAPWVNITQTASQTACSNLGTGYHLITNPEWMTIAANIANTASNWSNGVVGSGTMSRGHSDNSPASACAANASDANAWVETNCTGQTQGALAFNQRRTQNLSNGNVIWDIGGNVWQWVDKYDPNGKPGTATNAWNEYSTTWTDTANWPRSALVPLNSVQNWWNNSWNSTQSIGQFYPSTNGAGGALLRGANWNDGAGAGPFAVDLHYAPSHAYADIGLRCAWQP